MVNAIVLAAGTGKRMNSSIPKQYMQLAGKPVVFYTLQAFEKSELIDNIILVAGTDDIEYCKNEIVRKYGFEKVKAIVSGGKERYNSVYNGLSVSECDYILIHDGARPLVSEDVIRKMISSVKTFKACVAAVKVKDTIKIGDDSDNVVNTPDRRYLWQIQTPQAFDYKMITCAYEKILKGNTQGITDDAMIWEKSYDLPVKLIEAEYSNIKITTPEDMIIGEAILSYNFMKDK